MLVSSIASIFNIKQTLKPLALVLTQSESLRSLVLSPGFETDLDYLGKFVFVTDSAAGSAKVILDNEVMAWRPHAIVLRKLNKVSYK